MFLLLITLFLSACSGITTPEHKQVFDQNIYKEALDSKLCQEQIQYLVKNDTLLLAKFLDAGIRIPRGLLEFNINTVDYGNYLQCLNIQQPISTSKIQGKYCSIKLPVPKLNSSNSSLQKLGLSYIPWAELKSKWSMLSEENRKILIQYKQWEQNYRGLTERVITPEQTLTVAVCVPKPCTTQQFLAELLVDDLTTTGSLEYEDLYCRLPNDKQWVAGDHVAIGIFLLLFLILIASTSYDVYQTKILKNDPKSINQVYRSFSIYTNHRQLMTYNTVSGAIECLDGIRALSMIWIIVCHAFHIQIAGFMVNPLDFLTWLASPEGVWVAMSSIAVDTFFLMSGLLVVYSTLNKNTKSSFLKNIHIFYLNRIMRILPVLASVILITVSILNRISDGPNWNGIKRLIESCRVNWWVTLLFAQNWVQSEQMCLVNSWYLAVDMQLYILTPLVLFWMISSKKTTAWITLAVTLLISLVGSTIYNFIMDLHSSASFPLARFSEILVYMKKYYCNTLTRSSPFVIGMVFGYILHLYRNKRLQMSSIAVGIFWCATFAAFGFITWINYATMQLDWDNQTMDNLINSFMRPVWALAVGWIVLACQHGYGGPINWLLSMSWFKVLSRLSYAMYIVHFPLIFVMRSSRQTVPFFSLYISYYDFLADFTLALIVAYIITMLVDSPCANLFKHILSGVKGQQSKSPQSELPEQAKPTMEIPKYLVNKEST